MINKVKNTAHKRDKYITDFKQNPCTPKITFQETPKKGMFGQPLILHSQREPFSTKICNYKTINSTETAKLKCDRKMHNKYSMKNEHLRCGVSC